MVLHRMGNSLDISKKLIFQGSAEYYLFKKVFLFSNNMTNVVNHYMTLCIPINFLWYIVVFQSRSYMDKPHIYELPDSHRCAELQL